MVDPVYLEQTRQRVQGQIRSGKRNLTDEESVILLQVDESICQTKQRDFLRQRT